MQSNSEWFYRVLRKSIMRFLVCWLKSAMQKTYWRAKDFPEGLQVTSLRPWLVNELLYHESDYQVNDLTGCRISPQPLTGVPDRLLCPVPDRRVRNVIDCQVSSLCTYQLPGNWMWGICDGASPPPVFVIGFHLWYISLRALTSLWLFASLASLHFRAVMSADLALDIPLSVALINLVATLDPCSLAIHSYSTLTLTSRVAILPASLLSLKDLNPVSESWNSLSCIRYLEK